MDKPIFVVLNDRAKAVYVHVPDASNGHREHQSDISYDRVEILPTPLLNDLQKWRFSLLLTAEMKNAVSMICLIYNIRSRQ